MWDAIGHEPEPSLVVHHVNGDQRDDRIENLQLLTREEHIALHRDVMNDTLRAAAERRRILKAQGRS